MKVNETAQIAMRLMTEPELARFVRGTPHERTALAAEAIDRYATYLKSALEDPHWPTAARQASLNVLMQRSPSVNELRAA